MKELRVYNAWKESEQVLMLDENFYLWLKKYQKEIKFNQYGYAMIFAFDKFRPLHCVCYYLNHKVWSEQWVSALHHKDANKLNCTIENLQLVDWNDHGLEHAIQKGYYARPRPDTLEVA